MESNEIYNESYELLGVNNENQTIIGLYSYKFPPRSDYSNFLKYLSEKLKNNVQDEYVLIYFNQRLENVNPPTYLFLQNAYQQLTGDFKTKLKKLYVVNSTFIIKVFWIFNSIKSQEFYKKIVYVRNIEQLENELQAEISLKIPKVLLDFDKKINPIWYKRQFGVSLQFINNNHICNNYCPPILSSCVDYIFSYFESKFSFSLFFILILQEIFLTDLETEGIFRTSGDFETTNKIRNRINSGEFVDFEAEGIALTVVTDLFNSLFRKLSEPLLTFSNYDEICTFSGKLLKIF